MLEEDVAREVINRVQKLRKSAGLKVDDRVTMYYTVTPQDHNLAKIITKFSDYIQTSSKTPVRPLKTDPKTSLKRESYDLKGAKLEFVVMHGFPPGLTIELMTAHVTALSTRPNSCFCHLLIIFFLSIFHAYLEA